VASASYQDFTGRRGVIAFLPASLASIPSIYVCCRPATCVNGENGSSGDERPSDRS
jgi:hypothetical protein